MVKALTEGESVKCGGKKIIPKGARLPEEYNVLKQSLSKFFQAKVQLTCSDKGKGKISIPFANEEELELHPSINLSKGIDCETLTEVSPEDV